jgi:hypothetical protein
VLVIQYAAQLNCLPFQIRRLVRVPAANQVLLTAGPLESPRIWLVAAEHGGEQIRVYRWRCRTFVAE